MGAVFSKVTPVLNLQQKHQNVFDCSYFNTEVSITKMFHQCESLILFQSPENVQQ